MQKIPLKAEERTILGKKVKNLRKDGFIPAHVFGNRIETEHVSVKLTEFLAVFRQAGETGVVELKISADKVRPVMIREVQVDPVSGEPLHIDFYQVNLKEKVVVPVPVILIGEELELVHTGEAVVIQPLGEVEVEALPTDLPEKIEVDIAPLKAIGDVILVSQLQVPEGVAVLADQEAVVAKLDSAVTEEMKKLLEEQAAEAAAATEVAAAEEGLPAGEAGAEVPATAEATAGEPAEGETPTEGEASAEEKPQA